MYIRPHTHVRVVRTFFYLLIGARRVSKSVGQFGQSGQSVRRALEEKMYLVW